MLSGKDIYSWTYRGVSFDISITGTVIDIEVEYKSEGFQNKKKLEMSISDKRIDITGFYGSAEKSSGLGTAMFNLAIEVLRSRYPNETTLHGEVTYQIGDNDIDLKRRYCFWNSFGFYFYSPFVENKKFKSKFECKLKDLNIRPIPERSNPILRDVINELNFNDFTKIRDHKDCSYQQQYKYKKDLQDLLHLNERLTDQIDSTTHLIAMSKIEQDILASRQTRRRKLFHLIGYKRDLGYVEDKQLEEINTVFTNLRCTLSSFKKERFDLAGTLSSIAALDENIELKYFWDSCLALTFEFTSKNFLIKISEELSMIETTQPGNIDLITCDH